MIGEYKEIMDGEMTEEKFLKLITLTYAIQSSGIRKEKDDKAVDAWFNNIAGHREFYRYIDIENYVGYLKRNDLVKDCIEKYGLENIRKELGRKQNDYTHNNGIRFLSDNLITFYKNKEAELLLEDIQKDIAFITSYFLTILILIKPKHISSVDYIYYMEEGITPPEDSQYWVAPIVQDYLDEFIVKISPNLKLYLKDNNPYGMKIV